MDCRDKQRDVDGQFLGFGVLRLGLWVARFRV